MLVVVGLLLLLVLVTNPDGPLGATPASEVTPLSFLGNALKGMARAGLGFPMGVAAIIDDPAGVGTAILKDYGKRYGALWGDPDSNFIESTLEDPTLPMLDALGVVPGVGLAAKGAQLGKVLAVTSKGARPARLGSALELQTAERIAMAEAYDAARVLGIRLLRIQQTFRNKKLIEVLMLKKKIGL